jgi:hypothetical protein
MSIPATVWINRVGEPSRTPQGTEKTAVRDGATVENIAARIENEVDVLEAQPSAFENISDDCRDEVDVLRAAPTLPELSLR